MDAQSSGSAGISSGINSPPSAARPLRTTSSKENYEVLARHCADTWRATHIVGPTPGTQIPLRCCMCGHVVQSMQLSECTKVGTKVLTQRRCQALVPVGKKCCGSGIALDSTTELSRHILDPCTRRLDWRVIGVSLHGPGNP